MTDIFGRNSNVAFIHNSADHSGGAVSSMLLFIENSKIKFNYNKANNGTTVADLGGVPRVPWNPPFGFSCYRKLWKPGLQQNPTVKTVTTN